MVKVISKVSCPNCGAVGNAGSVCEFCGTTIVKIKSENTEKKSSKRTSDRKDIIVGYNSLNEEKVVQKAYEWIKYWLELSLNDSVSRKMSWDYINPIEENIKLFDIEVSFYNVPLYLYKGVARNEDTKENEEYLFIVYAGKNGLIPLSVESEFRFGILRRFNMLNPKIEVVKSLYGTEDLLSKHEQLFVKNKNKLWDDSLEARSEKKNYSYSDNPIIEKYVMPLYYVKIGYNNEHTDMIISGDGQVYSMLYSDILKEMLANHHFGEDYKHILQQRKEQAQEQRHNIVKKRQDRIHQIQREKSSLNLKYGIALIFSALTLLILFRSYNKLKTRLEKEEELTTKKFRIEMDYEKKSDREYNNEEENPKTIEGINNYFEVTKKIRHRFFVKIWMFFILLSLGVTGYFKYSQYLWDKEYAQEQGLRDNLTEEWNKKFSETFVGKEFCGTETDFSKIWQHSLKINFIDNSQLQYREGINLSKVNPKRVPYTIEVTCTKNPKLGSGYEVSMILKFDHYQSTNLINIYSDGFINGFRIGPYYFDKPFPSTPW